MALKDDADLTDEVDEVAFDYSTENDGRTHILVAEFHDFCDEEEFLIALKSFLKAQNENLRNMYANKLIN